MNWAKTAHGLVLEEQSKLDKNNEKELQEV